MNHHEKLNEAIFLFNIYSFIIDLVNFHPILSPQKATQGSIQEYNMQLL